MANGGDALYISADGAEWRDLNFLAVKGMTGMAWADGAFFALSGKTNACVSYDGVAWSKILLPSASSGMTVANGSIWVYGENSLLSRLQFTAPPHPKLTGSLNPDGSFSLQIDIKERGDYAVLGSALDGTGWTRLGKLTNVASTVTWTDQVCASTRVFLKCNRSNCE